MSLSLSQATVPYWVQSFNAMLKIIDKAEAYAEAKKIDPSVLINARLAPDMKPLSFQVQAASDVVKLAAARLAGVTPPSFPDTETTFDELRARIHKTIDYVQSVSAEAIDGALERVIELKFPQGTLTYSGRDYAFGWVAPNFYFHVTTFYDILRHNGMDLSKANFLGAD